MASCLESRRGKAFLKYGVDAVNIFILGLIAFVLPDQIFDGKIQPADTSYPGSNQTIVFSSNGTDGEIYNFTSILWITNPRHDRSYIENSAVSGTMLGVYDAVVPTIYLFFFVIVYFYFILKWNGKYLYYDTVSYFYAYLTSMGLVFWLTRLVKVFCGWHRPDFWDRCNPIYSYNVTNTTSIQTFVKCDYENFEYYGKLDDYYSAYSSFPSGHTSYMFAAAIVLAYFTYGKLNHPYYYNENLLNPEFDSDSTFYKCAKIIGMKAENHNKKNNKPIYYFDFSLLIGFILATWGLWASAWVAISRIDDHRHFPTDLLGGGILGFCCASFGYFTQYDAGSPFSKRVLRIMKKDRDIEELKRSRLMSDSNIDNDNNNNNNNNNNNDNNSGNNNNNDDDNTVNNNNNDNDM